MKLLELFQELIQVQKALDIDPFMICGGLARDKYMNKLENISDIDLTNGNNTSDYASQELAIVLKRKYNIVRKIYPDHSTIFIGKLKLDFSSNFMVPNIDSILNKIGIINPTNLQKEIYSRDFTCNSLLMTLNLKELLDPTNRGFSDINTKKIKTCLSPEITLTTNRNRVIRAIYLACKLGFDIDDSIIEYVYKNPSSVKISTEKTVVDKLSLAFDKDGDRASYYLTKMNLWSEIPIIEKAAPYYQKHLKNSSIRFDSLSKSAQRNFDLGTGLYENMDKYDSVKEFLDKNEIDFPIDNQSDSTAEAEGGTIIGDSETFLKPDVIGPAVGDKPNDGTYPGVVGLGDFTTYPYSNQLSGFMDGATPLNDFEGKSPDQLDFGRDYTEDAEFPGNINADDLAELENRYLTPAETDLFGMPDGIDPASDLDADNTVNNSNQYYGGSDIGTQPYEDKWNI